MNMLRVAVLMGGISHEREVALRSGAKIIAALDRERYQIQTVDFTGDLAPVAALQGQVDVVVLALHGPGGEDGRMQGLLDLLELPYTGSGVLGSAMAMHKSVAKIIYRAACIPTPPSLALRAGACDTTFDEQVARASAEIGIPCVVKPANEGSTIGISFVTAADELPAALADAFRYDSDVLVEQMITGTEISVPVLGTAAPRALPEIEICPKNGYYDYENKYTAGATEEICPGRISATARQRAADYAVRAHQALHCKGVSRTDMIVTGDEVTVLETNTLPGMTDTSLLPLSARVAGISFSKLLDILISDALGIDCPEFG